MCLNILIHKYFKLIVFIIILILIAFSFKFFLSPEIPSLTHLQGQTMGTFYNIKIINLPKNIDKDNLKVQIDEKLKYINQLMSMFDKNSEISKFNAQKNNKWFKLSNETFEVIKEAFNIYHISNHYYDISIAPLVNLWNFGVGRKYDQIETPDDTKIQTIKKHVGMQFLQINEATLMIRKLKPQLTIDLSSIAKGYGVDYVSNFLKSLGLKNFMVEIGGEVFALGKNQNAQDWKIGIETPVYSYDQPQSIQQIVSLNNLAIATSGNYRNYYEKDGIRYTHIINPITGYPITHKLASVSVIDKTCMRADALATALMVLGENDGYNIAQKNKIMAYFIIKDEKGFKIKYTDNFPLK